MMFLVILKILFKLIFCVGTIIKTILLLGWVWYKVESIFWVEIFLKLLEILKGNNLLRNLLDHLVIILIFIYFLLSIFLKKIYILRS